MVHAGVSSSPPFLLPHYLLPDKYYSLVHLSGIKQENLVSGEQRELFCPTDKAPRDLLREDKAVGATGISVFLTHFYRNAHAVFDCAPSLCRTENKSITTHERPLSNNLVSLQTVSHVPINETHVKLNERRRWTATATGAAKSAPMHMAIPESSAYLVKHYRHRAHRRKDAAMRLA